tara:strand:- start:306 stop:728 length:423 start_codon:yes stop_codon:yes gene_type:complete
MKEQIHRRDLVFNLDYMSLGQFSVGDENERYDDCVIQEKKLGYAISVRKGVVSNISIYLFGESYGFSQYSGVIKNNGKICYWNESTPVCLIKKTLGLFDDHWNDGVEENIQFVLGKYRIEFSWNVDNDSPRLEYISVELD